MGELRQLREVMPFGMGTSVQSVVTDDAIYVGGGEANSDNDSYTVMKFDLQQGEWTKLPRYTAKWFAMTSLNNQLLLVGGFDPKTKKPTDWIAIYISLGEAVGHIVIHS